MLRTLLIVSAAIEPASAVAQDKRPKSSGDPDVVVVFAKKMEGEFGAKSGIPVEKGPQGVQVLSVEDLVARNVHGIGDALRGISSANVGTPRTSAYQSFSLKSRGFLADQMRNGVHRRYDEDVDASALVNVGRIEVLKCLSSGSSANRRWAAS